MNTFKILLLFLAGVILNAQVGINTDEPESMLDVHGDVMIRVVDDIEMADFIASDSIMVLNNEGLVMRIPSKMVVEKGLEDGAAASINLEKFSSGTANPTDVTNKNIGDTYRNTSNNTWWYFNGTSWLQITGVSTDTGNLIQVGSDGFPFLDANAMINEEDGIVGNEVTGVTSGNTTLTRNGAGTDTDPYTLIVAEDGITNNELADNAVTTAKITDANVTTAKIADDAIDKTKIAADVAGSGLAQNTDGSLEVDVSAITGDGDITSTANTIDVGGDANALLGDVTLDVADEAITTAKLADNAVTTAKITDANVTTAKIADAAVTTVKIADENVTTAKLADNAVTTAKITDANVTTAKIADDAIDKTKIAADVAGSGLAQNTDGSLEVDVSAITGDGDITSTANTIDVGGDANALLGDVTLDVADEAITTAKLADNAVTTAKITDANVTTAKLADNAVTTVKIADENVTTAKLADNAVTTAKIADANVTTAKIADDAIDKTKIAADVAGSGLAQNTDGSLEVDESSINIAGDVIGTLAASTVTKIQGVDVSDSTPNPGQTLVFSSGKWTPSTIASSNSWSLLGNSGTNPNTNFIGTTDNQDLVFKVNNTNAGRIYTNGSLTFGHNSSLNNTDATALGGSSNVYGNGGTAVGNSSSANTNAIALGFNANSSGTEGIAIGENSNSSGVEGVAIGHNANTSASNGIAIGTSTSVYGTSNGIAIGNDAEANTNSVAIGANTNAFNANTIVLGTNQNVGIGTNSPKAKLDVNGGIRMSNDTNACLASNEGTQRYSSANKRMEFCDGTSWKPFGEGGYEKIVIWAEEGHALQDNANEWGFGDLSGGATGIPLPEQWEAYAVSFHSDSNTATSSVEIDVMDRATNNVLFTFTTSTGTANNLSYTNILTTPLNIPAGTVIGFRTNNEIGTISDARVAVWLRR